MGYTNSLENIVLPTIQDSHSSIESQSSTSLYPNLNLTSNIYNDSPKSSINIKNEIN